MENYSHLSEKDRWEFYQLNNSGTSMAEIARQLGRHRSTLYRELARNQTKEGYLPGRAEKIVQERLSQQRMTKIDRYQTLRGYIYKHLKKGWSPEQIAGRLKRKKSKYIICHETIYRYIYQHPDKKLFQYLRYKKRKRYKRFARIQRKCRFGDNRLITQRASYIEKREQWGHWEGDTIEFCGTKKTLVTTLVERKSRMVVLIKNETKKSDLLMAKIRAKMAELPCQLCRTITVDQGAEFASHEVIERGSKCRVYYCHTHSPWEKGSNENMNGRLRKYLPRCLDIRTITQNDLNNIANIMNATPRKCLGYRMPKELFSLQYNLVCRT